MDKKDSYTTYVNRPFREGEKVKVRSHLDASAYFYRHITRIKKGNAIFVEVETYNGEKTGVYFNTVIPLFSLRKLEPEELI